MEHQVGPLAELRGADCRVVHVDGRPVAVLSVGDDLFAVSNRCPHRGAPLSAGTVGGTLVSSAPHAFVYGRDARVLRCPWHGWEFDLETGRSLLEPRRVGVRTFSVTCEDGQVVLHTPDPHAAPG
ncbi:MAG: Rieske (2Fe-2S) protein [Janthinobacterium lividum]